MSFNIRSPEPWRSSILIYEGAAERIEGIQRLNVKLQVNLIGYGGILHIAELI